LAVRLLLQRDINDKDSQLVLDLHVIQSDDGYTAEVPSIKGCESWAHGEDEAIDKTIELLKFYLQSSSDKKIKIDRARREHPLTVYKLIFDK
jgi:predicted RNase H-like HicB family nuclease